MTQLPVQRQALFQIGAGLHIILLIYKRPQFAKYFRDTKFVAKHFIKRQALGQEKASPLIIILIPEASRQSQESEGNTGLVVQRSIERQPLLSQQLGLDKLRLPVVQIAQHRKRLSSGWGSG